MICQICLFRLQRNTELIDCRKLCSLWHDVPDIMTEPVTESADTVADPGLSSKLHWEFKALQKIMATQWHDFICSLSISIPWVTSCKGTDPTPCLIWPPSEVTFHQIGDLLFCKLPGTFVSTIKLRGCFSRRYHAAQCDTVPSPLSRNFKREQIPTP